MDAMISSVFLASLLGCALALTSGWSILSLARCLSRKAIAPPPAPAEQSRPGSPGRQPQPRPSTSRAHGTQDKGWPICNAPRDAPRDDGRGTPAGSVAEWRRGSNDEDSKILDAEMILHLAAIQLPDQTSSTELAPQADIDRLMAAARRFRQAIPDENRMRMQAMASLQEANDRRAISSGIRVLRDDNDASDDRDATPALAERSDREWIRGKISVCGVVLARTRVALVADDSVTLDSTTARTRRKGTFTGSEIEVDGECAPHFAICDVLIRGRSQLWGPEDRPSWTLDTPQIPAEAFTRRGDGAIALDPLRPGDDVEIVVMSVGNSDREFRATIRGAYRAVPGEGGAGRAPASRPDGRDAR